MGLRRAGRGEAKEAVQGSRERREGRQCRRWWWQRAMKEEEERGEVLGGAGGAGLAFDPPYSSNLYQAPISNFPQAGRIP